MNNAGDRIIYTVSYCQYDGTAQRDALLCAARRDYFKTGAAAFGREENTDYGMEIQIRYRIAKDCFIWKKKCGKKQLQFAYRIKNGYEMCTWNLQGEPVSKTSFTLDHIWLQTAYYTDDVKKEDGTRYPAEVLRPAENDGMLLLKWQEDSGKYIKTKLVPCELHMGTAEQSMINARVGEPLIYAETSMGSFGYCTEQEAALRETLRQTEKVELPQEFAQQEDFQEEPSAFQYIQNDAEPEKPTPLLAPKELVPAPLTEDYPANREIHWMKSKEKPARYAVAAKNLNGMLLHTPDLEKNSKNSKAECIKCPEDLERIAKEAESSRKVLAVPEKALQKKAKKPTQSKVQAECAGPCVAESPFFDLFAMIPAKRIVVSEEESYTYFGEILDDLREGMGRTQMANGHTAYEGGYHADKREGFGTYYYKSGKISYSGNWKENQRHGTGVSFSSRDGSIFVGHWENNIPTGKGSAFDAQNNLLYAGSWKDGKRCGTGTEYRAGKEYYTGEWDNDRWNGKGTLKLLNGTVVTGLFENGKVKGLEDGT